MPPGTLTSLPCLRPCSTDSRPLSKEGGERGVETHSHTEEEEEERERDTSHTHTHTHTQACTQAPSACRWRNMPARRVAHACCYAATRILTDARAPAKSLSCSPQEPLSERKPGLDLRAAHPSTHCRHLRLCRAESHVWGKLLRILRVCLVRECSRTLACTTCVRARVLTPPRKEGLTSFQWHGSTSRSPGGPVEKEDAKKIRRVCGWKWTLRRGEKKCSVCQRFLYPA